MVVNYASSRAGADSVVAAIAKAGGKAVAVGGDITKAAEAQGVIDAAIKAYARLNIGSGVSRLKPATAAVVSGDVDWPDSSARLQARPSFGRTGLASGR